MAGYGTAGPGRIPGRLVCLGIILLTCAQEAAAQRRGLVNICHRQKTCGSCIAKSEVCSWCAHDGYDKENKKRCDLHETLVKNGCDKNQIMNPNHRLDYSLLQNKTVMDAKNGRDAIQLQPQKLHIKLRPNKPFKFRLTFRQAEDYPVDLYYLMDLSNSMEDDKKKLAELGNLIADRMNNITKNFRLGFGSFVDKTLMPYVSIEKEKPCAKCAPTYGFKNQLSLNLNTSLFANKVREVPMSGNLDAPEGGFDAIMQAVVCDHSIGWRAQSRRMLVFSTDAGFHYAGDGKLGGLVKPNDGLCHLDTHGEYTESKYQDYPSIGQLASKITEKKVNVIFAVTSDQLPIYKDLSAFIEGSTAGKLANDSNNVVELIKDNYETITSKVELNLENAENVTVKFHSSCISSEYMETNECDGLKIGKNVTFDVSIEVKECVKGKNTHSFNIYPVGLAEKLTIDLDLICECECEKPIYETKNSEKCNYNGTFECGKCTCDEDHYGKKCECDGSEADSDEANAKCIRENSTTICSGRGRCECGSCECGSRSSNSDEFYTGLFCECDNYSCDHYDWKLCGGEERGRCVCGKCECNPGFSREDCGCATSNETCIASNGLLCNNQGECICGSCVCKTGTLYRGPTCEDCPTCSGKCNETKACVQCTVFKTGEYTDQECGKCRNITSVPKLREGSELTRCQFVDDDDCTFLYTYEYQQTDLIIEVQKDKVCPESVNIMAIVLGVIGGIVAVGLALLLIWKLLTTIHDRREFAKFEKEMKQARWDTVGNPIYKPSTSTFNNPTYGGKN